MRKIKRWIRNWLSERDDLIRMQDIQTSAVKQLESQGFQLKVIAANGGTIVETEKFDHKADRYFRSTYIVTDDKVLGDELAKIITMEQLR